MPTAVDKYRSYYRNATKEAYEKMGVKDFLNAVVNDPALQAAARMGHDEISHALKAFPDSIPITPEMGAIGEPTPQEVFADKQGMSPLEMYQRDLYVPEQSQQKEMEV